MIATGHVAECALSCNVAFSNLRFGPVLNYSAQGIEQLHIISRVLACCGEGACCCVLQHSSQVPRIGLVMVGSIVFRPRRGTA